MRKRETSRKRAAETEKVSELGMEDKEATPVSYTHLDVYKRQLLLF